MSDDNDRVRVRGRGCWRSGWGRGCPGSSDCSDSATLVGVSGSQRLRRRNSLSQQPKIHQKKSLYKCPPSSTLSCGEIIPSLNPQHRFYSPLPPPRAAQDPQGCVPSSLQGFALSPTSTGLSCDAKIIPGDLGAHLI